MKVETVFFHFSKRTNIAHTKAQKFTSFDLWEFEEFIQHMHAQQTTETKINGPLMSSNFILFCYDEIIPLSRETVKRKCGPVRARQSKRHEDNSRCEKKKNTINDENEKVNEKGSDVLRKLGDGGGDGIK